MAESKLIIPVILCGGSGTRLWPVSQEQKPKQFLNLMGDFSLLQETARRALKLSGVHAGKLVTVTLETMKDEVAQHLKSIHLDAANHILCEPERRDTAVAVAYAASYVRRHFGEEAILWVLPADHHIGDEAALGHALRDAISMAEQNFLVTFGIRPVRPETGYGYIRLGERMGKSEIFKAARFVEKPDFDTACDYMASGEYMWNSGMFMFRAKSVIEEFHTFAPSIIDVAAHAIDNVPAFYDSLPQQPFDRAIMEKSQRVVTVCCDPGWSDVGSWESLWEIKSKDDNGNVIEGRATCHETRDCLIIARNRVVACAGVDNIIVVETDDGILIANRNNAQAIKALFSGLKTAA